MNRRQALGDLALLSLGVATGGCSAGPAAVGACIDASTSQGGAYCLVEGLVVRVPGAHLLEVGASMLANVDDNTAVLVSRDASGFYARSAICTHQCCIVSLCDDADCAVPNPTPVDCGTVGPSSSDHVLCPCHGSVFTISDGVPQNGPATVPLPAYTVAFDGDDLLVDTGSLAQPGDRATT